MATQAPAPEQPAAQRAALAAVTERMLAELRQLWPSLPVPNLQPLLSYEVLPAISHQYGEAAATLAAVWYDVLRFSYNVPGRFAADLAPQPADEMFRAISNWAAAPAEATTPDLETALARTEGAAQKMVADMSRDTVKFNRSE